MQSFNRGVSVIICCYNSASRLPETLRHLAQQQLPAHIPYEVVVVNNASKDNTVEVAMTLWHMLGNRAQLRIVDELQPGQSKAREKGIQVAQYEYLLFCDDDNWLHQDYVRIAFELMEGNGQIGALGGLGIPECEVDPPQWFATFANNYAVGKQGEQSGDITLTKGYVNGAGSVLRKSVLATLKKKGFRPYAVGRTSGGLLSGDDNELSYAVILSGYKIWYDERLTFKHFIPKERLTFDYIKNLNKAFGISYAVLTPYILKIHGQHKLYKYTWQWLFCCGIVLLILKRVKWILKLEDFPLAACYEIGWLHLKNRVWGYYLFRKEINNLSQELHTANLFNRS
jgi:glycosyltransferase involved in cell wall biosynthesis